MNTFELYCNWQISLPDNWQGEYDKEDSHYMFYPDNSDLTIHITPFHAEKDGVPAPIEAMEKAFANSIPTSAKSRNADITKPNGFEAKMYEDQLSEENKNIIIIYIGYYSVGDLLSISIWGTNKNECEQALRQHRIIDIN